MITPLQDDHNIVAVGTINGDGEDDSSMSNKPDFVSILLDKFLENNDLFLVYL